MIRSALGAGFNHADVAAGGSRHPAQGVRLGDLARQGGRAAHLKQAIDLVEFPLYDRLAKTQSGRGLAARHAVGDQDRDRRLSGRQSPRVSKNIGPVGFGKHAERQRHQAADQGGQARRPHRAMASAKASRAV